jgi:hypothetical protein
MSDNSSTSLRRLNDEEKEKKLSEILKRYETLDAENKLISNILESFYKQVNDDPNSNLVKQIKVNK